MAESRGIKLMKRHKNNNKYLKREQTVQYVLVGVVISPNGEMFSQDIAFFNTEKEAEDNVEVYRKKGNFMCMDIYRYVDGKFDARYFNKKTTSLNEDSIELKLFGYDLDSTGYLNPYGLYELNPPYIKKYGA